MRFYFKLLTCKYLDSFEGLLLSSPTQGSGFRGRQLIGGAALAQGVEGAGGIPTSQRHGARPESGRSIRQDSATGGRGKVVLTLPAMREVAVNSYKRVGRC